MVSFTPSTATDYAGSLAVNSDATSGINSLAVSGVGFDTNSLPPAQSILGVKFNGDTSVTVTYATSPGYPYHLEVATILIPPNWAVVAGSATNATDSVVSFTDPNTALGRRRWYRVVSP